MDCDVESVRRFMASPPPFGVTALSLQVDALHEPEEEEESEEEEVSSEEEEVSSEEEEERRAEEATWSRFCAFWKLKLETLKLKAQSDNGLTLNHLLVKLMDSPNVLRLHIQMTAFCGRIAQLRDKSLTTSFFQKVRELRMDGIHVADSFRDHFFVQLEHNSNLTVLRAPLSYMPEFLGFIKVIDRKKDDMRLQLTFDLQRTPLIKWALWASELPNYQSSRDVLAKFATSIVASRSQIRLKVYHMDEFINLMTALLPTAACGQLLSKIESIGVWTPKEDSLTLLESLPLLRKLKCVKTDDSSVDFNQLTFPPSLEELGFSSGFPACQNLPQLLISLSLDDYACDVGSLVSSLHFLSRCCPELISLTISWRYANGKSPPLDHFETAPPPFPKLRELRLRRFGGRIGMAADVAACRTALLHGFDWRCLKLNFLKLCSSDLKGRSLTLVDGEILRNVCEGPSAKTLLTIQVPNESVTPEGLPLLEKLRSLAAENWKEREIK